MKYVFVDFEMNEIDRKYRKIRRFPCRTRSAL